MRIHCDGDKILIPIHAFPVINSSQDELFPNYIDMGRACAIGQSYTKQLQVESNCPVDFEYKIDIVKPHPEIHVSPLMGDIPGLRMTTIDFTYNPRSYSTAECEIEVRTSEFDNKPKLIRIVGSAAPATGPVQQVDIASQYGSVNGTFQKGLNVIHEEDQGPNLRGGFQPKTLLHMSKSRSGATGPVKLGKISARGGSLAGGHQSGTLVTSQVKLGAIDSRDALGSLVSNGANKEAQASVLANLKSVKLSVEEQDFIKEYRKLEELEREKGIKFFQCVGDPPHTQAFVNDIQGRRDAILTGNANTMRSQDCSRFQTEVDRDKVVVKTSVQGELAARPKWDAFENNHFAMRRRLVSIFLRNANKLICRLRAGRRLAKLRSWIDSNGIRTREDMRTKVAEDFKNSQNTRLVDDSESQNDIRNVKFEFNFQKDTIGQAMLKLPLEYETNIASFLEKVEANPPTNFDDLEEFDPLEPLDFEIQNYQPYAVPGMSQYDPAMRDLPSRPGCEYESVLRQRAGEPDLEKVQIAAHEEQKLLKREKKEVVSAAIVKMPQSFLKPLDYEVEKLLRSD